MPSLLQLFAVAAIATSSLAAPQGERNTLSAVPSNVNRVPSQRRR